MTGQIIIFAGNYGSGKTELAIHFALEAARRGKTLAIDLDMINTYFRLYDHREPLRENGVELIAPDLVDSGVEMLTVPPEIAAAFDRGYDTVVIDLGGDSGALALGQFRPKLLQAQRQGTEIRFYNVVNACRPMADKSEKILRLMDSIQRKARWQVDALINNSNMSYETNADDLAEGFAVIRKASEESGVPVAFTCAKREVLDAFLASKPDPDYLGTALALTPRMRRDWDRILEEGF